MSSQKSLQANSSVKFYTPENAPSDNDAGVKNAGETILKLRDLATADADPVSAGDSNMPVFVAEGVPEVGGRREGLEPTRYGDWEKKGRCIDF